MDRQSFAEAHPHPFLFGKGSGVPAEVLQRTGVFDVAPTGVTSEEALASASARVVKPVRKTSDLFPAMITVGRARNNDVVVEDALVSKFHAFFRRTERGTYELADAGSANGTRLNGVRLLKKGGAVPVKTGDRVQFAKSEFRFCDPDDAWRELRGLR